MTDMCINGQCGHPQHLAGVNHVTSPIQPVAPVQNTQTNVLPKSNQVLTGDDAMRVQAQNARNNFLVAQKIADSSVSHCTRK